MVCSFPFCCPHVCEYIDSLENIDLIEQVERNLYTSEANRVACAATCQPCRSETKLCTTNPVSGAVPRFYRPPYATRDATLKPRQQITSRRLPSAFPQIAGGPMHDRSARVAQASTRDASSSAAPWISIRMRLRCAFSRPRQLHGACCRPMADFRARLFCSRRIAWPQPRIASWATTLVA